MGAPIGSRAAVVIGGGPAGIAAARHLSTAGVPVTLIEASGRLGGCVRTVDFADTRLDVGAEALHTAAPEPLKLAAELGLTSQLVPSGEGPTWIAVGNRLHPLPAGVGPAGPTRLRPLASSRLLSPAGMARAALEPLVPRIPAGTDRPVGQILRRRFGREVVERIVDPLLGGLHAGDVDRLSLQAATPPLAGLLARQRSVLLAARGRPSSVPHSMVTLRGGLDRLFTAAHDDIVGDVRLGAQARAVVDTGHPDSRYRVETAAGDLLADAVVLAVPPRDAGPLLAGLAPETAPAFRQLRAASVAVVLLAYPAEAGDLPALRGTGILVPSSSSRLLKAATFLNSKWPHLSSPYVLVRASTGRAGDERAGRLDDQALVAGLARDLQDLTGLPTEPLAYRVVRWGDAMPQLEVGHRTRLSTLRAALAPHPGLAVAGSAYDGVGIPAALRSGTAAAARALSHLAGGQA